MKKILFFIIIFYSCNKPKDSKPLDDISNLTDDFSKGFFIINEGNFDWGVGTLSHHNPITGVSSHKIFEKKNDFELGNVFQSANIFEDKIFMVINNSEKIIIANYHNMEYINDIVIKGASPRYIQKINDNKYYITELYAGGFWVLNIPNKNEKKNISYKKISLPYANTERMLLLDGYIYMSVNKTTFRSEDNYSKVLKIDINTDKIIDEVIVPLMPNSMVLDKNKDIWILSGGMTGDIEFTISKLNPENMDVEFRKNIKRENGIINSPSHLVINNNILYFQNSNIWRFIIEKNKLEEKPFIKVEKGHQVYGINISIENDIYISDAIDYNQEGYIRIYDENGQHKKDIKSGIIPSGVIFIN